MVDDKLVFRKVGPEGPDLGVDVDGDPASTDYRDGMEVLDEIHRKIFAVQSVGGTIKEIMVDKGRAQKLYRFGLWGIRAEQLKRNFSEGWYDHAKQKVNKNFVKALDGGVALTNIGPIPVFVDDTEGIRAILHG
jgi:hypothetical protein